MLEFREKKKTPVYPIQSWLNGDETLQKELYLLQATEEGGFPLVTRKEKEQKFYEDQKICVFRKFLSLFIACLICSLKFDYCHFKTEEVYLL